MDRTVVLVVGSRVFWRDPTMPIKSLVSFALTCAAAFVLSAPAGALADCGDSILETAEQCDDGNLLEGDCCSSDCLFEPNGQVCDDGDPCSSDGTCSDGSCNATPTPIPHFLSLRRVPRVVVWFLACHRIYRARSTSTPAGRCSTSTLTWVPIWGSRPINRVRIARAMPRHATVSTPELVWEELTTARLATSVE